MPWIVHLCRYTLYTNVFITHRLIFDMGGPMNIYNEYMGGLEIYSNQYFVRNKFTVYIPVPSVDDALAFVSTTVEIVWLPLWRRSTSNRRSLWRSSIESSIVDRRQSAIVDRIVDRCGVDRHRIVDAAVAALISIDRQELRVAAVTSIVDHRGCRCGVDRHRMWRRCGVDPHRIVGSLWRSSIESSIDDRQSSIAVYRIVGRCGVDRHPNRRCCRCSSDINRSSRAQGCRYGVNCRSSRLPLQL